MTIDTAIVPVAGLGTRLLPVSLGTPKELLPLGRKPALQWILEELGRVGIRRTILVTSPLKPDIDRPFRFQAVLEQALLDRGQSDLLNGLWSQTDFAEMQIETVIQDRPLGLGHALLCARDRITAGERFVVALGDCLIGRKGCGHVLQRMIETAQQQHASIVIAFESVARADVVRYGIAAPASEGSVFALNDLVEKPSPESAPSQLAVAGRYVLSPSVFDILAKTPADGGEEIQLTAALRTMIHQGAPAVGIRLPEDVRRYDVGNWASYLEAFFEFGLADPTLAPIIEKLMHQRGRNV